MQQDPPLPQDPNPFVAGTATWGETPPAPPSFEPRVDYSRFIGVDALPYRGPRFETESPESFRDWHRNERRELREQAYDWLRGDPVNGREFLGNILTNLLGNAIRSEDDGRATPFDRMQDRTNGVERDRDGYRR